MTNKENFMENNIRNSFQNDDYGNDENYENNEHQENERKSDESIIDKFGIDLTKKAKKGEIDKVVGRYKEVDRMIQILSRRKKNNPVLIGEPGCVVGDTLIKVKKISEDTNHENIEINFYEDILQKIQIYEFEMKRE